MATTEATPAPELKDEMHAHEEREVDIDSKGSDEENATHSKDEALEPIEKVKSMHSVNHIASVPNGGLKAWLQVAGAFMLFFNTFGIINTFGAYQTYYETGQLFIASSSNLSWVGAIQAFALMFVGAFTGPVYDAGYFFHLLVSGSFLIVFGHMMLSLCHEYYQVLLAQGFCIGIGTGFLFVPAVAILSTYFTTKISFAMGVAASGSSLGGVIYPIVFFRLQPTIGFAWATRVLGFIILATLLIPICVMRMRVKPAAKRALVDWTAFKEPAYVTFVIGALVAFMGLYVPFFYIQYFAISTGITSPELGFYILAILNAGSVFGRTIPNYYAIKTGPLNMFLPAATISGILVLVLISVHDLAGIVIVALFYGFFSGAFVSLPPSIFVSLTKNRGLIGTRMGMGFTIVSIGILIGTPIGGIVLGPKNDFRSLWIFGGVLILAGVGIMSLTRMFEAKWKLIAKV